MGEIDRRFIAAERRRRMRKEDIRRFLREEDGIGVIEVVLILVVICTINLRCVLCVLWVFLTFKGYTVDSFNRSCILCRS